MNEGGGNGDYIGKGIDKVETPNDAMGRPKNHNSEEKSNVLNGEENPDRPLDRGEAVGREGNVLIAGEKNQQSDKTKSNGWINHTGLKVGMTAGSTVGMALQASRAISRSSFGRSAKVAGPIATILIVLGICIMGLMTSATFLVESLIPNIKKTMGTVEIAITYRTREIMSGIMLGKYAKGGPLERLPEKMKGDLANAGVGIEETPDGKTVLKVTGNNGKVTEINGNNVTTIAAENSNAKEALDVTNYAPSSTRDKIMKSDAGLEGKYGKAAKLDGLADVEEGSPEDVKSSVDENLQTALSESTGDMKAEVDEAHKTETTESNVRGETKTTEGIETDRKTTTMTASDADGVRGSVDDMAKKMVNDGMEFSGIVSKAAQGVCLVYNTAMTINRMIKAYEAAQVVVMTLRIFEAIQRMQAGDGGDAILAVFANYLTRPKTTEFELTEGDFTSITTSAIGSSALAQFYGGTKLTDNDTIVQSYITSSNQFRKIASSLEGGTGYKACTGTNLIASIIDAIGDVASLGTTRLVGLLVSVGISTAISTAIGFILSIMVPKIMHALVRDFSDFVEGAPAGGAIAWAAEQLQGLVAQLGGLSVGTAKGALVYSQKKAALIAEQARYDRERLSPFDISSEYTFMGSLMASLTRANLNTSSIIGRVGNIASVVGGSLVALTPASHAADAIDDIVTTGDHPEITELVNDGQKRFATAFGEPYYIPDFTTMGYSIEDVMWYWDAKGCFEEPYDPVSNPNPDIRMNGTGIASAKNPIILAIKEGRNVSNNALLAAYTDGNNPADEFVLSDTSSSDKNMLALKVEEKLFRGAPLGVPDPEIEAKYRPMDTGSSFWDKLISAIPVIGSVVDIVNNIDTLAHMSNILGSEHHKDTKENHMFEAYALMQRVGEMMGIFKKAQTAAYIDKYVEEHPLDKTMVGRIARNSGLTRDQVITAFKQINALKFIADYHPDGLGPLFYERPAVRVVFGSSLVEDHPPIVVAYYTIIPDQRRNQNSTI